MKKQKLVIRFDDEDEVASFDKYYIFDNEMDAINFFMSYDWFLTFYINVDGGYFTFKGKAWEGRGEVFYAVYH